MNYCHPNYASYLINKQTISVKSIHTILKQLPMDKRDIYDKQFIEDLYINYQNHFVNDSENLEVIKNLIGEKKILIIAPGKSIGIQKNEIHAFIKEHNPFVCCINFIPDLFMVDAVFISNQKRLDSISDVMSRQSQSLFLITTSNITDSKEYSSLIVNYSDLLIDNPIVSDNAGLMLLNLLDRLSIKSVYIAGFDGFSIKKKQLFFL